MPATCSVGQGISIIPRSVCWMHDEAAGLAARDGCQHCQAPTVPYDESGTRADSPSTGGSSFRRKPVAGHGWHSYRGAPA